MIEELLTHKAEVVKAILQEQNPFPDSGIPLLTKIIGPGVEADKVIDLSYFCLSSEQIIHMVAQFQIVKIVKLSHNPHVTVDTIRGVMSSLPHLRSLFLLDTSVDGESLCKLIVDEPSLFFNIEALVHPHYLQNGEGTYLNAFSLAIYPADGRLGMALLPYFTPALVVQALVDYLFVITSQDFNGFSVHHSELLPQMILASDLRRSGQKWTEQNVPLIPLTSLRAFDGEGWSFL